MYLYELGKAFMTICVGISTMGAAGTIIYKAYAEAKKPQEDTNRRLDNIEKRLDGIDQKLTNDYTQINQNRDDMNLLMRSMFDLIENKITGNNVEGLKKTRDDLIHALTDK